MSTNEFTYLGMGAALGRSGRRIACSEIRTEDAEVLAFKGRGEHRLSGDSRIRRARCIAGDQSRKESDEAQLRKPECRRGLRRSNLPRSRGNHSVGQRKCQFGSSTLPSLGRIRPDDPGETEITQESLYPVRVLGPLGASGLHTFSGLFDHSGDSPGLRNIDSVAALDLYDRRTRAGGHEALGTGWDHLVLGDN